MFLKSKKTIKLAAATLMLLLAPAFIQPQVMHVELEQHTEEAMQDAPTSVKNALQQANQELTFSLERSGTAKFTGQFYIGSKKSPAKLILDSGSDWLFVESEQCEACQPIHRVYNPDTSTTKYAGDNDAYVVMYESLYVVGDDYFDNVCIASKIEDIDKYCVKNFRFLAVTDIPQEKGKPALTPMDGMLGLGPDDPANGPSFVAALYNEQKIGRKMFGLAYGKQLKSQITFGGWDETFKRSIEDEIYFFPQTNNTRWEIELRDVKMSNTSFWTSTRKVVIDTFFRVVSLPLPEYENFKNYIEKISSDIICNSKTRICQFEGKCSTRVAQMPQLRLQFCSMQTFAVNPQDYLDDRKDDLTQKDVCVMLIQGTEKDYMQVGQSFLFNYYTIFDFEKSRVGFFLVKGTNSEVNNDGVFRPDITPEKFPVWAIILIALVVLGGLVGIFAYVFVKYRNRKLAHNLAEYNQLEGTRAVKKTIE
eukprot:403350189